MSKPLATWAYAVATAVTCLLGTPWSVAQAAGAFVEVSGSKLFYEECGTAAHTVVLIHDGVVNSAVWDEVWPTFCGSFHTIRYDRRGYGHSPESSASYSEVDDLAALLHHVNARRVSIVGSSHGASLSIAFTLAHPAMVQQLVLVGPVVSGMPYSQHFLERGRHAFERIAHGEVRAGLTEWSQDKYLIAPSNEAARRHLLDLMLASPQDATHGEHLLESKPSLPRLGEIRVPTLIVTGDADIADVHAHAGAIEAGIANSRRIVVAGTGHLMYLEKPAEFARLVIDFLRVNFPGE